jgi:hypothetical protein
MIFLKHLNFTGDPPTNGGPLPLGDPQTPNDPAQLRGGRSALRADLAVANIFQSVSTLNGDIHLALNFKQSSHSAKIIIPLELLTRVSKRYARPISTSYMYLKDEVCHAL